MILDIPDYLTSQEIKQLLNVIDDVRDRAIVILFLSTGLFLNEMADLKADDINWEKRIIQISGKRKREIPISNECYETLALWSQARIDNPQTNAFFLRTKGKPVGLSSRGLDDLIRKYGQKACLKKTVNAHILRNTFAIRLFQDTAEKVAIQILGITDTESIARYKNALLPKQKSDSESSTPELAKHSTLTQLINRVFPIEPKIIKSHHSPVEAINPEDVLFGRDKLIKEIQAELNKGQAILLTGQLGIGKSHLLKYFAKEQESIYFSSPTPIRQLLLTLLENIQHQDSKTKGRSPIQELLKDIVATKPLSPPLLIIDNLHQLKVSDLNVVITLLEHFTILAATDSLNEKLKVIWWKFQTVELEPLDEPTSKNLIRYMTQNLPISDYQMLQTKLLSLANGNPLAITDMITHLSHRPVVSRQVIRDLYHDAGVRYRDWTPAIIIFWALLIMSRFIALGTHSFEGYILVGFGTSFFLVVKYFLQRMK